MEEKKTNKNERKLPLTDEEIGDFFVKAQKYHDDLDKQINAIYEASGMSQEQFLEYIDNKSNFTELEWTQIQQMRERHEKEIESKLPKEFKKLEKKKAIAKKKKKLHGKQIGYKKKWLEMD